MVPLPYKESIRLRALPEPARPAVYEMRDWRDALVGFSHKPPEPERRRLASQPRRRPARAYIDLD